MRERVRQQYFRYGVYVFATYSQGLPFSIISFALYCNSSVCISEFKGIVFQHISSLYLSFFSRFSTSSTLFSFSLPLDPSPPPSPFPPDSLNASIFIQVRTNFYVGVTKGERLSVYNPNTRIVFSACFLFLSLRAQFLVSRCLSLRSALSSHFYFKRGIKAQLYTVHCTRISIVFDLATQFEMECDDNENRACRLYRSPYIQYFT